jgi:hypothetical protein
MKLIHGTRSALKKVGGWFGWFPKIFKKKKNKKLETK